MKIPNGHRAVVDLAKLRDYCLSPQHPEGRYKAWVFAAVLGLQRWHALELREMLLRAAGTCNATLSERDDYGQRYVLDFEVKGPRGHARVRSIWIVRTGEDFPRLVTCFIPRRVGK